MNGEFQAALALTILAYNGITTITNSGSEVVDPHRNGGSAIIVSITVCAIIHLLVAFGVSQNLPLPDIIAAKDFALAEAARPAFGDYGLWFTVALAIVATASGLIAGVFDIVILGTFLAIKAKTDMLIIIISLLVMTLVFTGEWIFLRSRPQARNQSEHDH